MKVHRRRRYKFRDAHYAWLLSFMVACSPGGAGTFTMKVPPPSGGINSGMPNAPGLLSFMVVRSLVGAWRLLWKSAAVRRHKFRDYKCAWTTFIHGGAIPRGRIKVTLKVHRRRRYKFKDGKCTWTTFIHGGAITWGAQEGYVGTGYEIK